MSIYAETANSFYISPRKLAAGFMIAASLLLVAAKCSSDDGNSTSGPRSPLDTNGTRGSGYTPPGGWGGRYMPKGMGDSGKAYVEPPDEQHLTMDEDKNQRAAPSAIALPGDILSTTSIVFSFTEEDTISRPQVSAEPIEI